MLEFIWNIICDFIHDVFVKHVYDTVAQKTVDFLHTHVPAFVEPENCPPNSPDLNLVDYSIMRCFTATCLPIAGSRHWAPEGRSGNKLGTNQPGLYWSSNWTVSETISLNHCSEGRPCWTFFRFAVWLLLMCYISFAYVHVCDVEMKMKCSTFLCHPVEHRVWSGDETGACCLCGR